MRAKRTVPTASIPMIRVGARIIRACACGCGTLVSRRPSEVSRARVFASRACYHRAPSWQHVRAAR